MLPKVIPVVTVEDEADALRQFSALEEGGLPVAEITFRTPYAAEAISLCRKKFPAIYAGAGSVVNIEQAKAALGAGAKFLVSPGLDEEIGGLCEADGAFYLPCAVTPAEIMRALALGYTTLKFFPAQVYGGLSAIKALSAPFPAVRFVPTGGVDETNLKEYLSFGKVAAVGGSFMMKGDIVSRCRKINEILNELQ